MHKGSEPLAEAGSVAGAGVFSDELKHFKIEDCKEKQPVPSLNYFDVFFFQSIVKYSW